jgi:hypothetical protein
MARYGLLERVKSRDAGNADTSQVNQGFPQQRALTFREKNNVVNK